MPMSVSVTMTERIRDAWVSSARAPGRLWDAAWRRLPENVQTERNERHWPKLGVEIVERLMIPTLHPTFIFFLIAGILVLGGVPFELEYVRYLISRDAVKTAGEAATAAGLQVPPGEASFDAVLTALHTFYPVLAWSSAMQMNFVDSEEPSHPPKSLRALAFVLATATLLISILMTGAKALFSDTVSMHWGYIGVFLSVLLWWLANSKERTFRDRSLGANAQGGSDSTPIDAMPGDTKGFVQ
jgi:hypothetical protein